MYGGGFRFFAGDGSNGATARIQHSLNLSKANAINQWVHVVVTYTNQSQVNSYVNGVLTNTTSTTYQVRTNSINNGIIGAWPQVGDNSGTKFWYLNGKLDAVTLWTKTLTNTEASALYNNGTGLQYSFPSSAIGYTSTTNDALNTNNGTAVGGLTYGVGKIGNAFQFNGTNAYVLMPVNSMKKTIFSMNFWLFNPSSQSKTIFSDFGNNGLNQGFYLNLVSDNSHTVRYASFSNSVSPTNTLVLNAVGGPGFINRWSMTTLTVSGTSVKIYLDGVLEASGTMSATLNYVANSYPCVGAFKSNNNVPTQYLANETKIDAFNVWDKELTATEITELYNSGNGKQYPN